MVHDEPPEPDVVQVAKYLLGIKYQCAVGRLLIEMLETQRTVIVSASKKSCSITATDMSGKTRNGRGEDIQEALLSLAGREVMRDCSKCKRSKPQAMFSMGGIRNICKECERDRLKKSRQTNEP